MNFEGEQEFLFFSVLNLKEQKTLYELSRPELKVLIAQFNLSETKFLPYKSKTEMIEFINERFSSLFPHHPRKHNELIFGKFHFN